MSLSILIGVGATLWLVSCVAALFALRWNLTAGRQRFHPALIAACLALLTGYWGLSHYHFQASKTVNGHTQWAFNSKWFFVAALVLGALSLGLTLWNRWKPGAAPPPVA
jgi:hypothetical protein